MRELDQLENNNLKVLTEKSISFTLIEPTKTALHKSIMDATAPVRKYLKDKGLHDYDLQGTGARENGVNITSLLYLNNKTIEVNASLYRPKAKGKGGNPRIWFSKLNTYSNPNDILALIDFDKIIHVINLSQIPIRELITDVSHLITA